MPELVEMTESEVKTKLSDQLDAMSTQLIIDGSDSLTSGDFEALSQAGIAAGKQKFATIASNLALFLTGRGGYSEQETAGILGGGVDELRRALEIPANGATGSVQAPATSAASAKQSIEAVAEESSNEINLLAGDESLIREFITESNEHLSNIESQLLELEKDDASTETLNAIFRGFHTIKGLAGFLEFDQIQALAHEVETLLDLARTGQLTITPPVVDVILESTDVVTQELKNIETRLSGKTPPKSTISEALLQRIRDAVKGEAAAQDAEADSEEASAEPVAAAAATPAAPAASVAEPAAPAETRAVPAAAASAPSKSNGDSVKQADSASVRIDTAKLDLLMDMVGEMVIAQTLIGHSPALSSIKDSRFTRDLTQLARITADVQRITTGMRMVPIGNQFQKTARLVRDLSRKARKEIVFETSGEDTELDKTIAEELSDPLLHMVRNSIDHGIEPPDERVAKGKESTAHIRIAAYHQSGQIVIAISDDGRGLSREKILAKAIANGLIQPDAQLTDNEIYQLIFEPGFSTAEKITDISGRGVGMDVVRKHVQKLRGRIEIQTKPGEGTTFYLKLPLTLAIIEGLVVMVGSNRYIVPIFSVKEMFRPTPEMLSTVQGKGEMTLVRGSLLPIVRLHQRFNVEPRSTNISEGVLIVAESEGKQFCIFVDELVGKQEVVIKSLGQSFKKVVGVAGCAILGDGRVGLIMDVDGIYTGRS